MSDVKNGNLAQETTPTKEDFAKWSRVWHDTCETILTLLDLPGGGSPQEALAQVQNYVSPRSPAVSVTEQQLAEVLNPDWWGPLFDGRHPLDNFPEQHKHYREHSLKQARSLLQKFDVRPK